MELYFVANNIQNTVLSLAGNATHGQSYVVSLIAQYGYKLPKKIQVKVDGKAITNFCYTKEGKLEIAAQAVTGDIQLEGKAEAMQYAVSIPRNISIDTKVAEHGEHFVATLTAERGYALPETLKAKVNGRELDAGYYFYSSVTGEFVIHKVDVVGKIEIFGKATEITVNRLRKEDAAAVANVG